MYIDKIPKHLKYYALKAHYIKKELDTITSFIDSPKAGSDIALLKERFTSVDLEYTNALIELIQECNKTPIKTLPVKWLLKEAKNSL